MCWSPWRRLDEEHRASHLGDGVAQTSRAKKKKTTTEEHGRNRGATDSFVSFRSGPPAIGDRRARSITYSYRVYAVSTECCASSRVALTLALVLALVLAPFDDCSWVQQCLCWSRRRSNCPPSRFPPDLSDYWLWASRT